MPQSSQRANNNRLFDLLDHPAESVAIIAESVALTYGELRELALTTASFLEHQGFRPGDRIAVMLPNGVDWLAVMFGAAILDVAVVSVNVRSGAKDVGDMLAATRPFGLIYDSDALSGTCTKTLEQVGSAFLGSIEVLLNVGQAGPGVQRDGIREAAMNLSALPSCKHMLGDGDGKVPCFVIATSGTTGRPKMVVHVQERIVQHASDVARAMGFLPNTSSLVAMPFCGGFGFTLVMAALAGGQRIVIQQAFEPATCGKLVNEFAITHMGGTNDMIYNMLNVQAAPKPFPTLHHFIHANFTPSLDEMPPEAERRGVQIRGGYGSSEMLALFTIQPPEGSLATRAEAGGFPVSKNAGFRIVDSDSKRVVPIGVTGEIEVFAPNAMVGYLDNPIANAEVMTPDGYLRTGDLGCQTSDGRLRFETRSNDVLRIGGYLVSPVEIEDVILQIEAVTASQVVAVQRDLKVRPVAFVTTTSDVGESEIISHCQKHLAKYKIPVRVFRVVDFPYVDGPNGRKVKRNELRDLAQQMMQ